MDYHSGALQANGFTPDLVTEYGDLPPSGYERFENKTVAVFGLGNAAMEAADGFAPHAAFVHVFPGRGTLQFPKFAYETRCPVVSRSISPRWCSIRIRLAPRTYAPCGPSARVVSQTKSRKIPTCTRDTLPLVLNRGVTRYVGDVRALRSQVFDAYMLKSLDGGKL